MKKLAVIASTWALPLFALAQVRNIFEAANLITVIINNVLVPLVFAVAFLVFIWGVFTYFILSGGNQEKREEGQKLMMYGIVGFFVMVAVWGLVNILVNTFQLNQNIPNLPQAPGPR
jgi:hypothetical protein